MKKQISKIAIIIVMLFISHGAKAQWHVDPTFGTTSPGLTLTDGTAFGSNINVVNVINSFKTAGNDIITVVSLGRSDGGSGIGLIKMNSSGQLISSFGTGGTIGYMGPGFGFPNYRQTPVSADMDGNGNIYVCGEDNSSNANSSIRAFVSKFNTNGVLLNTVSEQATFVANSRTTYQSIVVQPNGDVICFGAEGMTSNGGAFYFFAKRYNSSLVFQLGTGPFQPGCIITSQVKGIVKSTGENVFALAVGTHPAAVGPPSDYRFYQVNPASMSVTATGMPFILADFCEGAFGMRRIAGDKILFAANNLCTTATLYQFTSTLTLDLTLNGTGSIPIPPAPSVSISVYNMQIDNATGNIYLFSRNTSNNSAYVTRLLPSGAADTNFPSAGGSATFQLPLAWANPTGINGGFLLDAHHILFYWNGYNQTMLSDIPYNLTITSTFTQATCPNLLLSANVISSTTGVNYQWYFNGNPITGATSTTYLATANGNYSLSFISPIGNYSSNILPVTIGQIWYPDADGDGYGASGPSQCSLTQPPGFVLNNTDCNDASNAIHPGAIEICDGIDNNCDGTIDFNATPGKSLAFDGSDDYVLVPNAASIQPGMQMTVECWAKSNTSTWNNYGFLVNKGSSVDLSFMLHPENGSKNVRFQIVTNLGASTIFFIAPGTYDITQWHHYAGTFDGNTGALNFYVDGNLVTNGNMAPGGSIVTFGDLNIGRDPCCSGRFINGSIDEVRLWNVTRTDCQIKKSMSQHLSGFETGLMAYYDFNNPNATAGGSNSGQTTLVDLATANGADNGTLNNFSLSGASSNWVTGFTPISRAWYADADGDGYAEITSSINSPTPPCNASCVPGTDCNDANNAIHPGAAEVCNGIDDDCDGLIDDADPSITGQQTWYADADGDGFGNAAVSTHACNQPSGYVSDNSDCNDNDVTVHAPQPYYIDADHDGYGSISTAMICASTAPVGYSTDNSDCNDADATVHAPVQYYVDADHDGKGSTTTAMVCASTAPVGYSTDNTDCDDADASVHTPVQYYVDADHDGYGSTTTAMVCASSAPVGYSTDNTDCDDADATVHAPVQYYVDADNDGYGSTTTAMVCASSAPVGYSTINTDCDDADASVHAPVQYYVDADHDGYGSTTTAMVCASTAPVGYSIDNTDCDDADATVHAPVQYYVDADHDGYGSTTTAMVCASSAPVGYSTDNTDCDDADASVHAPVQYYVDADHDGYGSSATAMVCASTAPIGYSTDNTDCNDNDASVHAPVQYYVDADHDGYGSTTTAMVCASTAPLGYSTDNTDCNDNDASVHAPVQYYVDADHDGYGSSATAMVCASSAPVGYSTNNTDCDDANATVHAPVQYYVDADHDGYGSTTTAMVCASTAPVGYSTNNTDCNDNDATVHAPVQYYVDADHDGYGSTTTAMVCASTAPVGYSTNNTDCNDANASVHPNATEVCGNGIDDNCNGQINEGCGGGCNLVVNAGMDESTYFGYSGDQQVTRTAIVTGGTAPYTYSWTIGRALKCNMVTSAGDEIFSGGTCTNTVCPTNGSLTGTATCYGNATVTVRLMDTTNVCVAVTDANNCTATDCFLVMAEDVRCFAGNSGNYKIKVCHHTGSQSNPWVQLCIADNAVAAHLANNSGDFLGTCSAREAEIAQDASSDWYMDIFPNPARQDVAVSFIYDKETSYEIQLIDVTGRLVKTYTGTSVIGENDKKLNLENLSKGIYKLVLFVDDKQNVKKLVVE